MEINFYPRFCKLLIKYWIKLKWKLLGSLAHFLPTAPSRRWTLSSSSSPAVPTSFNSRWLNREVQSSRVTPTTLVVQMLKPTGLSQWNKLWDRNRPKVNPNNLTLRKPRLNIMMMLTWKSKVIMIKMCPNSLNLQDTKRGAIAPKTNDRRTSIKIKSKWEDNLLPSKCTQMILISCSLTTKSKDWIKRMRFWDRI